VNLEQSIFLKTYKYCTVFKLTLALPFSDLSKAHFILHCSHGRGSPNFFRKDEHRWHFLSTNAAIKLQNRHTDGWK